MRSGDVTRQDVEKMVEGLRQRLEHEPNNPQGWSMLARSYMQLERHKAAAEAYKGLATALEKIGEGEPASAWGGLRAQALLSPIRAGDQRGRGGYRAGAGAQPG